MAITSDIDGFACRLRSVKENDAQFILDLRSNQDHNKFLPPLDVTFDQQIMWISAQRSRSNDYYFIVQNKYTNSSEGVIGLYQNPDASRGFEWGRWIMSPGSLLAVESAYLLYQFAFENLNLKEVYCNTVKDNLKVVNFHNQFGAKLVRVEEKYFCIRNQTYDGVRHEMSKTDWIDIRSKNESVIQKFSALAMRS